MTVNQLENFLVVAQTLNFRKAAERIYIAQPALTRQIQQLEEEIDAILFDRTKKQIQLTPAGLAFREEIQLLIEQLRATVRKAQLIEKGEAGEIKIAHPSSAMHSILPALLKHLSLKYPLLKAHLIEAANKSIFDMVRTNAADFGFVVNGLVFEEFEYYEVYKENYVLVLPESHPFDIKSFKNLGQLSDENWILYARTPGSGYMDELFRIFGNYGFHPRIVHESSNTSSVLRLVEAGLGITFMGKSNLIGYNLKIKSLELVELQDKLNMKMLWKKNRGKELAPYIEVIKNNLSGCVDVLGC